MQRKFGSVQLRELVLTVGPALALVLGGFWLASKFVAPPPPRKMVIAAATPGSPYHEAAQRYRRFFADNGVELEVMDTRGSLHNLALISDPNSNVSAAFLQGGLAGSNDVSGVRSVGRIFYEPVWIFYRGDTTIERLTELKGKRVLIGPQGSGTAALATRLLSASGVTAETATLVNSELPAYVEAFEQGSADAGFLVLAPEARTVRRLLAAPGVRLLSLTQADAYAQRFPFLSRIELKQGVVDFAKNIPPADTLMLSTTAAVVIRQDLHSALANLLTQAVISVHAQPRIDASGEAGILHRAGAFPIPEDQEYQLSPDAQRVYKSGPPFLQRYMPFWMATLADRLIVFLLPALGILLPTLRFAPMLYTWRVRRRIVYWYRELKRVEAEVTADSTPEHVASGLRAIDKIEDAVNRIPVPLTFANQLYDLRGHIDVVRRRLLAINPAAVAA